MSNEFLRGPYQGQNEGTKLTIRPQTLYSERRGNSMDESQGEIPKLTSPALKTPGGSKPSQQTGSQAIGEKLTIAEAFDKVRGSFPPPPQEFFPHMEDKLTEEQREQRREAMAARKGPEGVEALNQIDEDEEEGSVRRRGIYGERRLTNPEKRLILAGRIEADRLFNRMFIRVDAKPKEEFREAFGTAGEIEYNEFITTFTEALEDASRENREKYERLITKYSHEKDLREILHNANYSLLANVNSEKFVGFFQNFTSDMADAAYRTTGVTLAAHVYEQALRKVIDENRGYLPAVEVAVDPNAHGVTGREGRVESLAQEYFDDAIRAGLLKGPNGWPIEHLQDWEKKRALSLARGMGIVTMRTIEILGQVKLPEKAQGLPSLYGQDIVRDLVPFRHLIGKFGIGMERLAILGFKTGPGGFGWSQKELIEFKDAPEGSHGIVNGEASYLGERYIQQVNPYESGSIFSHTGWRAKVATTHLDRNGNDWEWLGTGVRLERLRSDVKKEKGLPEDQQKKTQEMMGILRKIAEIQPLKLFRQMPDLDLQEAHDQIIQQLFGFSPQELKDLKVKKDTFTGFEQSARLQRLEELAKHFNQAEKDLTLLQEKAVQDGTGGRFSFNDARLDFEQPFLADATGQRKANAQRLADAIKNVFLDGERKPREPLTRLAEKIGRDDWPFVFGSEDVPHDQYRYVEGGPTAIARTLRDFGAESKAVAGTIKILRKMDSYKKPEQIMEDLREVYESISGYDETKARRVISELAEGIMKFYGKDWWARLPLGAGTALGFLAARGVPMGGLAGLSWGEQIKSSYAKTAFGNEALGWDETDKWKFTKALEGAGMIGYSELEELRKRVGATRWHYTMDLARTFGPLAILIALMEFSRTATKDLART
ncbi:hypothetical protein HY439_02885 [Candidatus Microgenomates bacterium]|nr:hypothetical protein [Candidatus Microgenomates bacterium]